MTSDEKPIADHLTRSGARPPAYLKFSLSRPVTVFLGVLTLLVLGSVALERVPLQMFPSGFSGNFLHLFMPLRDITPSQVERDFVPEVEDVLRNLPDLVRLETTVSPGGFRAHMVFGPEADMSELAAEVRDRMERVRHLFPPGVERFYLWHFNPEVDMPVVLFSVSFPAERTNIWYLLEEVIRPSLESLPSVGRVDMWGYVPRHIATIETLVFQVTLSKFFYICSFKNTRFRGHK